MSTFYLTNNHIPYLSILHFLGSRARFRARAERFAYDDLMTEGSLRCENNKIYLSRAEGREVPSVPLGDLTVNVRTQRSKKTHNTSDSHLLPSDSTKLARRGLASVFERVPAFSSWYDRA